MWAKLDEYPPWGHASAQWASSGSRSSPSSASARDPCGCIPAGLCRWDPRSRCGRNQRRSAPGSPSAIVPRAWSITRGSQIVQGGPRVIFTSEVKYCFFIPKCVPLKFLHHIGPSVVSERRRRKENQGYCVREQKWKREKKNTFYEYNAKS